MLVCFSLGIVFSAHSLSMRCACGVSWTPGFAALSAGTPCSALCPLATMGLCRCPGAPWSVRRRASFGASVAVASLVALAAWTWRSYQPAGVDAAPPRRLISEVYPDDPLLTKPYFEDPKRWLMILHCLGIAYMLLGLNTVCDVYFTGALEVMVERWKIKPDVAGATFMAAGGSAPELFTSLIGATVESDVGFSTIVGSAVFNILFVIGLCGYFAKEEMVLTWWPLFHDRTYYIFGLALLAVFASDGQIMLAESVILFGAYLVYCTIMYFNTSLEALFDSSKRKAQRRVAPDPGEKCVAADTSATVSTCVSQTAIQLWSDALEPEKEPNGSMEELEDVDDLGELEVLEVVAEVGTPGIPGLPQTEPEPPEEDVDDDALDFIHRPEGVKDQIIWALSLPIYIPVFCLTPPPSERWFVLTFAASLMWIAGFACLLVWWVEIIGDIVFQGSCSASIILCFPILAAGTSILDAVSSVAVAKEGEGDMAVSSSIVSNIFDILVGLPIPWTINILMAISGEGVPHVGISSPFLFFYVVLLLFMVFLTICSIHFLGWRLNRRLGAIMAALYGLFLAVALTTEFMRPHWLMWGKTGGIVDPCG